MDAWKEKILLELLEKLHHAELALMQKEDNMSAEDARTLHHSLVASFEGYVKNKKFFRSDKQVTPLRYEDYFSELVIYESLQKNLNTLLTKLKKISGINTASVAKVSNDSLESRFRLQKSLTERITSLVPKGEIGHVEAEVFLRHLNQLYEQFTLNQIKIEELVSSDDLHDQIELAKCLQRKVTHLQIELRKLFAPSVSTASVVDYNMIGQPELHYLDHSTADFRKYKPQNQ